MFFHRDTNADELNRLQSELVMHTVYKRHMESVNKFYKDNGTTLNCPGVSDKAASLIDAGIKSGEFPDGQPFSQNEILHEYYELQRLGREFEAMGGDLESIQALLPGEEQREEPKERPFYETALDKPLEQITEDIFLRRDAFEDAPWYDDFVLYTCIGVCEPKPEHLEDVRKALKMMGYTTHVMEHSGGGVFIVPGEAQPQRENGRER